ncbi:glycosyltransferase family 2 protein [Ceratobasidium sp. AG-I]|nr:glycosyltransferase family 2 protein [Ceratobasidium sp. AG-I]
MSWLSGRSSHPPGASEVIGNEETPVPKPELRKDYSSHVIVVAGGNGFIGSHVAKHYHGLGYHVRVVDHSSESKHDDLPFYTERIIGNLCDIDFCRQVVHGARTILHFAAVMGGMGVIHEDNDPIIYRANHAMTLNLLQVSHEAGVETFFFASSACVYPSLLQAGQGDRDVALRESSVYSGAGGRPEPQALYGLEKLNSEQLALQYKDKMHIRIARFHNVYGPRGSWCDGREKAPAAFVRKALAAKLLGETRPSFEIWGDGTQRRSFLYIDDAVRAVVALMDARGSKPPLNIGSDQGISILDLAKISLEVVGLNPSDAKFTFKQGPVGVASRNSQNDLVKQELSWSPRVNQREGLAKTAKWMEAEMQKLLLDTDEIARRDHLTSLTSSRVVDLASENLVTFAILLPITSRGAAQNQCIENLDKFAQSLASTIWRDRNELCGTRYDARIYLAIDHDDDYLLPHTPDADGRAEFMLRSHGFSNIVSLRCTHPKGYVCALWRDCAHRAFQDECDYYVLMGDDVELLDEGWMRALDSQFAELARQSGGPKGFGCVAFTDLSFPGMPTFPVVHRTHMEIFGGEVIPKEFINQDGDPYLFQLYRHFGASATVSSRLRNSIGGTDGARYEKQSLSNWTFEPLELGKETVKNWANIHAPSVQAKLSLDIVVPSYRVHLPRLSRILSLKPSSTCITMFIIIIDDPHSPFTYELEHMYAHRMDVRIRVNKTNQGASASRNRGLRESSAEWVAFLDDDVDPSPDYLVAAERYIRGRPDAAGFVGNAFFPPCENVFTTAVHLANVTYFWDIADKIKEDIPWGVTANLIVRRNMRDDVKFDLVFPKTGGGEDIDFCRQKRRASLERGGTGFWPAPEASVVHPWWNEGKRSYWRFYMWSKGDGALIKMYPQLAWRDSTPNSAELFLFGALLFTLGGILGLLNFGWKPTQTGMVLLTSTFIVNLFHDAYNHLGRHRQRAEVIKTPVGRAGWVAAVFEGALIRMFSEQGRLVGLVERGEWVYLGKRFDWFAGGPYGIAEERSNGKEKLVFVVGLSGVLLGYMWH